ncbi:MAG: GxxExxY protein [Candidatus Magasanikbacteria bacterium]|nr:GxxExxY protein [Candidatus Magasanikbacteria bacterium]
MGGTYLLRRNDLLYPELSFRINGILYEVARELGGGHQEKHYQKAVAVGLQNQKIKFQEQFYTPLTFQGEQVGKYFLDFLVEDNIVIELKRGLFIPRKIIEQTFQYLQALDLQLGIIACFTNQGVIIKRIINQRSIK